MGGGVVANLGHALAIWAIPAVADEMVYTGRDVALPAQPVIPDLNSLVKVESRHPRGSGLGCAPGDDRRAVGSPLGARQRQRVERRLVAAVCAEDVDRRVLAARLVQGRG